MPLYVAKVIISITSATILVIAITTVVRREKKMEGDRWATNGLSIGDRPLGNLRTAEPLGFKAKCPKSRKLLRLPSPIYQHFNTF